MEPIQPPHNAEAEYSVLGAILIDNHAYDKVSWLKAEQFYAERNRLIWGALVRLLDAGKAADLVTVGEELNRDGTLEQAGSFAYIGTIQQTTVSAINVVRYAEIVRDKAILRELVRRSTDIAERALKGQEQPADLAQDAEAAILSILDGGAKSEVEHIGVGAADYIDWVDEHPNGIETGLKDLDSLTGGLLPGNLVIIAGRPHMGKTALALQAAEHICATEPGIVFSLEATRREVAGRLIEWHKHKAGREAAVEKVFKLRLFVDETAAITPALMRSRLRRMKRQHGVSLIVVDYLQLVRGKGDSREQEVAFISRELKAIAKEFSVPVIALSQLNRKVEDRQDKRPHMADLRESGAIEQDADLVFMLYRPDYYDENFQDSVAEAEILVPKNRNNGRTGLVKVSFSRNLGRFGDYLPERFRVGVA